MANVGLPGNGGVVVGVDEVDMIRRPADHEDEDYKCEHLDNLKQVRLKGHLDNHN